MSMLEWFVALAAMVGGFTTIYTATKRFVKPIIDINKKIDKLIEHDKEQYLAILRLTVMAEAMPISERLIAGKQYICRNGNGDVKKYYEELVKEHTH